MDKRWMKDGWMTAWIVNFVDELTIRCLGGCKDGGLVHRLLLYGCLEGSMDEIMARWMYDWRAFWLVRWRDGLMPLGWMTDWIDIFVEGWTSSCLDGWKDAWWVHKLLLYQCFNQFLDVFCLKAKLLRCNQRKLYFFIISLEQFF